MIDASEPLLAGEEEGAGVGGAEDRRTTSTSSSSSSSPSSSSTSKIDQEDNSVYIKFDPYRVETVDDTLLRDKNRKPSVVYELRDKGRDMCASRFVCIVTSVSCTILTPLKRIQVHSQTAISIACSACPLHYLGRNRSSWIKKT